MKMLEEDDLKPLFEDTVHKELKKLRERWEDGGLTEQRNRELAEKQPKPTARPSP